MNPVKSVFIGDHVWIGQNVTILKGTRIDSGSIIGAGSVVAGKNIPHNQSWAGNPCRKIANNVFGDGSGTHAWADERVSISQDYPDYILKYKENCSPDFWIYKYLKNEVMEYLCLDNILSKRDSAADKMKKERICVDDGSTDGSLQGI